MDPKTPEGVINIFILSAVGANVIFFAIFKWISKSSISSSVKKLLENYGIKDFTTETSKYAVWKKDQLPHIGNSWFWLLGINVAILLGIFLTGLFIKEGFFFEVSPERARCLQEQVSRDNFGERRGCLCCGKGTVGGIPPNYAQWLAVDPDTGSNWHRPDAVSAVPEKDKDKPPCNSTVQTFSNAEEASCSSCTQPSYITYY